MLGRSCQKDILTVTYKSINDSAGKCGTSLYDNHEKGIIFPISKNKRKNLKVDGHVTINNRKKVI